MSLTCSTFISTLNQLHSIRVLTSIIYSFRTISFFSLFISFMEQTSWTCLLVFFGCSQVCGGRRGYTGLWAGGGVVRWVSCSPSNRGCFRQGVLTVQARVPPCTYQETEILANCPLHHIVLERTFSSLYRSTAHRLLHSNFIQRRRINALQSTQLDTFEAAYDRV